MSKYFAFLDETGDHDLSFVDENFPLFLLSCCIIEEKEYENLQASIDLLKNNYFGTTEVILHSREIRKCEGPFKILFDLDVKKDFYKDLDELITNTNFSIIGSAIDKLEHIKQYGKSAMDPYHISLAFVMERLIHYTKNKDVEISICIEKRGKKEDLQLLERYNRMMDRGTFYVKSHQFKERITSFKFNHKRDNIVGLQLADLCAYPTARFLINTDEPNPAFDILKDKLCKDKSNKIIGFGLKIFPTKAKSPEKGPHADWETPQS